MKRVAFRVSYPPTAAHPIHRRLADTDEVSRMELLVWGPTAEVTTLSWYDAEPATVRELLTAVETAVASSTVAGDGGTYAFLHQSEYELDADVLDLVARSGVVFLPPVVFLDDGDAVFEAVGEQAELSRLYADLGDLLDTRIERVSEFRKPSSPARLTDRQQAALAAAEALGYYDVPRTGSVSDVAAELDCARSTAGELLRKAEAAVVREQLHRGGER
ncbi:HTH DNA binding domain-containing protein [Halogranum gelatinilyticum]|uniref:HTH DNA binding domain-containing protein n=1 Tax=Halogranum gelatinilyticum TaxID=660521 RepID=A0A1G9T8M4_9EURY|nr:helix-turn-helix domain-containing protein [Halogranum gelatinilyticum]SDM43972.1 HTH DNA binding domain-containing protein [Halogranum gelatinilyticum]